MAKQVPEDFDLRSICDALGSIKTKWQVIGVQLGVPLSKLQEFKQEDDPLSQVVDYLLRGNVPESVSPRSWDSIVSAPKSEYVGEPGLAEKISQKYCQKTEPKDLEAAEREDSSPRQTPKSKMDPNVQMDLEFVLETNLEDIVAKYASYVDCLRCIVADKGVSSEELCSFLLSLPASRATRKGPKLTRLSDKEAELKECHTITAIFTFLATKCASFLNYDIFQNIVKNYGIISGDERLKYPEYLKEYIEKHKISEFAKINPHLNKSHKNASKELILKYDIETTCSLAQVDDLKRFIAKVLKIHPSALDIIDIEDGCVIVTFLIPSSVADTLFTPDTVFAPQQEEELRANSVLWLQCNGHLFSFSKKDTSTGHSAMKKLKEQLTCSVCLGIYNNPKVLQCLHVYCQQCLMGLVQQDQQGQPTLTCPTCRQVTPVPVSGVAGLQADFRANQLLEILNEDIAITESPRPKRKSDKAAPVSHARVSVHSSSFYETTTFSSCQEHKEQMKLICKTCKKTVCWKCVIRSGKHHRHDYEELLKGFERFKKRIASILASIDKALASLDARCDEISNQRAMIEEQIHSNVIDDVGKTQLITHLHHLTQTKLKGLATQRDQIETIQAQLSRHLQVLEEANVEGDVEVRLKDTTVQKVKELAVALRPMLEPIIQADLLFLPIEAAGHIEWRLYEGTLPDPSSSFATGKGTEVAEVGQISTIDIHILNFHNNPCKVTTNSITCELVSERTGVKVRLKPKRGESEWKVSYQPKTKGRHHLNIKLGGQHILGSPYRISVKSQATKLGDPISSFGGVEKPLGVAINQKGGIVVIDGSQHSVVLFNPNGKHVRSFNTDNSDALAGYLSPNGVAVDNEGNILVIDQVYHNIQKISVEGRLIFKLGFQDLGILVGDERFYPRGIAFSTKTGYMYISNPSSVEILNSDFSHMRSFGRKGSGEGEFQLPKHIACSSNTGNVYVADWGNHRIQVFTAEGQFLRMFGKCGEGRGDLKYPYGVAVDLDERVYVSEYLNARVSVFTSEGEFLTAFGSKGEGLGQFINPYGLAVDDCGIVYVCDLHNHRVQLF